MKEADVVEESETARYRAEAAAILAYQQRCRWVFGILAIIGIAVCLWRYLI